MRKKILFAAVSLFASLTAVAQREVGSFTLQPKVGMTVSSFTNDPHMGAVALSVKGAWDDPTGSSVRVVSYSGIKDKFGLIAGFEAEYQMSRRFSLSAGLLYSMQGAKYDDYLSEDFRITDAKVRLEYVNIPIMANFYVVKGLALKAGLQPSFCVKDEVKGNLAVKVDEGETIVSSGVTMPDFKTFDLSVPVGVSYEYHDFVIGALYNIGLTDVFGGTWDGGTGPSSHNSVLQFTLGYKFGL